MKIRCTFQSAAIALLGLVVPATAVNADFLDKLKETGDGIVGKAVEEMGKSVEKRIEGETSEAEQSQESPHEEIFVEGDSTEQSGKIKLNQPRTRESASGRHRQATLNGDRSTVREAQHTLNNFGYQAGPEDGLYGTRTAEAIRNYQRENGLPVNGNVTPQLIADLQSKVDDAPPPVEAAEAERQSDRDRAENSGEISRMKPGEVGWAEFKEAIGKPKTANGIPYIDALVKICTQKRDTAYKKRL